MGSHAPAELNVRQGLDQIAVGLLSDPGPAIHAAKRNGRLIPGATPTYAVDPAMLTVAPKFARPAGIRAPVAYVHRAVRPDHHVARAKERIIALHQFELFGDLEG